MQDSSSEGFDEVGAGHMDLKNLPAFDVSSWMKNKGWGGGPQGGRGM